MIKIIITDRADLNKGVKKTYLDALLATKDNAAHQFDVQLFRGQAQEQIPHGAAVNGYFIRYSDNATVPLEGTASGNIASVTLTRACYNKPGQFALIIKVMIGDVINTVFYGEGSILASSTDTYVDEENVIPSLEELIARIAVMESGTSAANAAASSANTAANRANAAATKIDGMTVSAEKADEADAVISEVSGVKHISFKLPKGDPGPQGPKGDPGTIENVTITSINGLVEALDEKQPIGNYAKTVNNTAPDSNGNVQLNAESVGALPSGGTAANAEKLGGKPPIYYTNPLQIIDNPEFTIASCGYNAKHGSSVYLADRWSVSSTTISYQPDERRIVFSGDSSGAVIVEQIFSTDHVKPGDTVTVAVKAKDVTGTVCLSDKNPQSGHADVRITSNSLTVHSFVAGDGSAIRIWANGAAVLDFEYICGYVGEFTAEALPPYVPRGYGAELAECQRYYQIVKNGVGSVRTNEDKVLVTLPLIVAMRSGISVASATIATIRANGLRIDNPEFEVNAVSYNNFYSAVLVELSGTFAGMGNGVAYIDGTFHLSADLKKGE